MLLPLGCYCRSTVPAWSSLQQSVREFGMKRSGCGAGLLTLFCSPCLSPCIAHTAVTWLPKHSVKCTRMGAELGQHSVFTGSLQSLSTVCLELCGCRQTGCVPATQIVMIAFNFFYYLCSCQTRGPFTEVGWEWLEDQGEACHSSK